jgi:hypothetical protein
MASLLSKAIGAQSWRKKRKWFDASSKNTQGDARQRRLSMTSTPTASSPLEERVQRVGRGPHWLEAPDWEQVSSTTCCTLARLSGTAADGKRTPRLAIACQGCDLRMIGLWPRRSDLSVIRIDGDQSHHHEKVEVHLDRPAAHEHEQVGVCCEGSTHDEPPHVVVPEPMPDERGNGGREKPDQCRGERFATAEDAPGERREQPLAQPEGTSW